jgi:hypothetical protein
VRAIKEALERLHWYLKVRCGGLTLVEALPPRTVTTDNRCDTVALYTWLRGLRSEVDRYIARES